MNNLQRWNKSMQYKKKKKTETIPRNSMQKKNKDLPISKNHFHFRKFNVNSRIDNSPYNIYSNSNENQRNNDNEKYIHRKRA